MFKDKSDAFHISEDSLYHWLANASSYKQFKSRLSEQIHRLGIGDWSYSRLDLPDQLTVKECLGTLSADLVDEYMKEQFYEVDIVLKHANVSDSPIFQHDIESLIHHRYIDTEEFRRCHALVALNKHFGYENFCCLPMKVSEDGGRALFSVTSKGIGNERFIEAIKHYSDELFFVGQIANDVGILNYPEFFVQKKVDIDKLIYSQPFNFLATMVKYDLNIETASIRLGISPNTANKHLKTIREKLGARTTYGAFRVAQKLGLLDI